MSEEIPTSLQSTNDAYQTLIDSRTAVNKGKTEEAEKAREESTEFLGITADNKAAENLGDDVVGVDLEEDDDADSKPDMSWKKDDIVDYLLKSDVEVERDELEKMTKTQLLDRYTDYAG